MTTKPAVPGPSHDPSCGPRPAFARWLEDTNDITRMFLAAGRIPGMVNLAGGLPEPATYPVAELAELARQAVAEHPGDALNYAPIEGLPELRAAVAGRLSAPGRTLGVENVLIVSGGMQGLDLIGKVLLDEGGLIAVQAPTYLGALDAWRPRRPRLRPFAPEAAGLDLEATLRGAQFAYTVPNFSNPTGRLVGLDLRRRLVAAAATTGTWLVEDDPYGGLHYDGAPLPRMLSLTGGASAGGASAEGASAGGAGAGGALYAGPVIYMGTLSKALAPGLRIGWVVAAPEMIEALTLAKQGSDLCTSGLGQRIAVDALRDGLVEAAEPRIRACYRDRRDALCAALARHLGDRLDWEVPVGGMFVWAVARDPDADTDRLLARALEAGVCFSPSRAFDPEGRDRRALRLNFTRNPPEVLEEGVRRLARAMAM